MATVTVEVALSASAYTGVSSAQPVVAVFLKPGARVRCNIGLNSSPPAAGVTAFVLLAAARSNARELGGYARAMYVDTLAATDNVFLLSENATPDTVLVMRGDSRPTPV